MAFGPMLADGTLVDESAYKEKEFHRTLKGYERDGKSFTLDELHGLGYYFPKPKNKRTSDRFVVRRNYVCNYPKGHPLRAAWRDFYGWPADRKKRSY